MGNLLYVKSNSSAIIENNTLTDNNASLPVYYVEGRSSIQLNNAAFIRNKLMGSLLVTWLYSRATIQNNTLTENDASFLLYYVKERSSIQLINTVFFQNRLMQNLLYMSLNSHAKLINNTIIGNDRLDAVFFAKSSFLGIDGVFIKNNKFSDLIWLVNCKTSLDSMQVIENSIRKYIIYVESTAGRMNNTRIENYDQLMASAITLTCVQEGCKNSSFEFTNIKITWTYQLQLSARPIIQLSGKVLVLNVKILVTSISEIEVLRYETERVIVLDKEGFKIRSSDYNISSLFIGCTKANVKYIMKLGTLRCIPCTKGTYTFKNGSLKISTNFQGKKVIAHENATFSCLDCPVGAKCSASIKTKSNFYGYRTKEQKLKFLPCPGGFCCTGIQCNTINSCIKNRAGTLCGRCTESFAESFLSAECIPIHCCRNFAIFWLIYFIYALTLATFMYYMKDLMSLIKTAGSNLCKMFTFCRKEEESESEIDAMIYIVRAEEESEKISHFTVSGIFALIISFYQMKQVMRVDVEYKSSYDISFIAFISNCLNLEIVAVTYVSYCPMSSLDAVSKTFIKTYLLTGTLLMASLINYAITRVFHYFRSSIGRISSLKASERLGVCFIRILMLSYKNIASGSIMLLNCVEVAGVRVLFIKGHMECYQWWQIVIAVFFFTWILLFPLSLKLSFEMFMKDKISFPIFILCLMVPFAVVANYRLNRSVVSVDLQKFKNAYEVKEILREIYAEPYRFKTGHPREETVFYETWRLYQRVLLAIVATFYIDPIVRITLMTPIVFLIAISYFAVKPYKPEMYILHWIEVYSILGVFVCLVHNMFRGFLYVYDINYEYPVTYVWQVFVILDVIFSPVCVLIYFFVIKTICSKSKCKIKSLYLFLRREYWKSAP